jgi:ABC-type nickel/cobalt efflux system permease component RcnA
LGLVWLTRFGLGLFLFGIYFVSVMSTGHALGVFIIVVTVATSQAFSFSIAKAQGPNAMRHHRVG